MSVPALVPSERDQALGSRTQRQVEHGGRVGLGQQAIGIHAQRVQGVALADRRRRSSALAHDVEVVAARIELELEGAAFALQRELLDLFRASALVVSYTVIEESPVFEAYRREPSAFVRSQHGAAPESSTVRTKVSCPKLSWL